MPPELHWFSSALLLTVHTWRWQMALTSSHLPWLQVWLWISHCHDLYGSLTFSGNSGLSWHVQPQLCLMHVGDGWQGVYSPLSAGDFLSSSQSWWPWEVSGSQCMVFWRCLCLKNISSHPQLTPNSLWFEQAQWPFFWHHYEWSLVFSCQIINPCYQLLHVRKGCLASSSIQPSWQTLQLLLLLSPFPLSLLVYFKLMDEGLSQDVASHWRGYWTVSAAMLSLSAAASSPSFCTTPTMEVVTATLDETPYGYCRSISRQHDRSCHSFTP